MPSKSPLILERLSCFAVPLLEEHLSIRKKSNHGTQDEDASEINEWIFFGASLFHGQDISGKIDNSNSKKEAFRSHYL